MSCCGQHRAAWRQPIPSPHLPAAAVAPPRLQAPLALAHRSAAATVARGPATGLTYVFGADRAPLAVDARDVRALLASGLFSAAALP